MMSDAPRCERCGAFIASYEQWMDERCVKNPRAQDDFDVGGHKLPAEAGPRLPNKKEVA